MSFSKPKEDLTNNGTDTEKTLYRSWMLLENSDGRPRSSSSGMSGRTKLLSTSPKTVTPIFPELIPETSPMVRPFSIRHFARCVQEVLLEPRTQISWWSSIQNWVLSTSTIPLSSQTTQLPIWPMKISSVNSRPHFPRGRECWSKTVAPLEKESGEFSSRTLQSLSAELLYPWAPGSGALRPSIITSRNTPSRLSSSSARSTTSSKKIS